MPHSSSRFLKKPIERSEPIGPGGERRAELAGHDPRKVIVVAWR